MEKNKYLLSVVIPVYNAERYIAECVESVKLHLPFAEIIVVNDGSVDNSKDILEKYEKNGDIKLINKENEGVSVARNIGIQSASGKYITFIDADDIVLNTISINQEKKVDLYLYNYQDINEKGETLQNINVIERISSIDDVKREFILGHKFNVCWGKIFRADLIKRNSIFFPGDMKIGEDMYWFSNYLKFTETIECENTYFYGYRQNNQGAMVQLRKSMDENRIREFSREIQIKSAMVDEMEWDELERGAFLERFSNNTIAKVNFFIKSGANDKELKTKIKELVSDNRVAEMLNEAQKSKYVPLKRKLTCRLMSCPIGRNIYLMLKK